MANVCQNEVDPTRHCVLTVNSKTPKVSISHSLVTTTSMFHFSVPLLSTK